MFTVTICSLWTLAAASLALGLVGVLVAVVLGLVALTLESVFSRNDLS